MVHQQIVLEKYDNWCIDVYYGVTHFDEEKIMDKLYDMGCDEPHIREAYENVSSGDLNTGLTYSNIHTRESLIVIGVADSPEQFINSLSHEQFHVVSHISKAYGLDMHDEEVCYLMGKIAQATFVVAKHFMCECDCCINKVKEMI